MTTTSSAGFSRSVEELTQENAELREQVRRLAAGQRVAQGAMQEATHEKDATARIAQQVVIEEQATRAAVEVQGSSLNFAIVMHFVNFFMLVVLAVGLFFWLPREISMRQSTTIVGPPGSAVVPVNPVPVR